MLIRKVFKQTKSGIVCPFEKPCVWVWSRGTLWVLPIKGFCQKWKEDKSMNASYFSRLLVSALCFRRNDWSDLFPVSFPINDVLKLVGWCLGKVCLTDLAVVLETLELGLVRCFGPSHILVDPSPDSSQPCQDTTDDPSVDNFQETLTRNVII